MWKAFHHPDFSLPVVRRALADQLCDLAADYLEFSASPMRWWLRPEEFESRPAYDMAVHRLRQQGLIVSHRKGRKSTLTLTAKATQPPADSLQPEKHWRRKWSGIWYLLMYDVPEKDRRYRTILRSLLRQQRLGCLQHSVWVSPHDIRPQYQDVVKAAEVQDCAFLFEARTVLGQSPDAVVRNAWDFTRLEQIQGLYCRVFRENLQRWRADGANDQQLAELLRAEAHAYQVALADDPLLPKSLCPAGYLGPQVVALHRDYIREYARRH